MIDLHSHILPNMDDGSRSVGESLDLLDLSRRQGVDIIAATPHFYADEDDPESFIRRRDRAYSMLRSGMESFPDGSFPEIRLGAEVLYFHGMSQCYELRAMVIEGSYVLLVEPPMEPWTDTMLDEIEQTGENLKLIPVIAHIDRYMRIMRDFSLIGRLRGRKLLAQINGSFLLYPDTSDIAARMIADCRVHVIGSDCHNMINRAPNMAEAEEMAKALGISNEFARLHANARRLLGMRKI